MTNYINNVFTYLKDEYNMQVKIQKWGNSLGIRLPSTILKSLNWTTNDQLALIQKENKIIIEKTNQLSLEERFKNYDGPNLAKDFEWDEPKGKEIW